MTSTAEDLTLRAKEFYAVYDIHVMTTMECFSLDTEMNHATFKGTFEGVDYTDYVVEYDQVSKVCYLFTVSPIGLPCLWDTLV